MRQHLQGVRPWVQSCDVPCVFYLGAAEMQRLETREENRKASASGPAAAPAWLRPVAAKRGGQAFLSLLQSSLHFFCGTRVQAELGLNPRPPSGGRGEQRPCGVRRAVGGRVEVLPDPVAVASAADDRRIIRASERRLGGLLIRLFCQTRLPSLRLSMITGSSERVNSGLGLAHQAVLPDPAAVASAADDRRIIRASEQRLGACSSGCFARPGCRRFGCR